LSSSCRETAKKRDKKIEGKKLACLFLNFFGKKFLTWIFPKKLLCCYGVFELSLLRNAQNRTKKSKVNFGKTKDTPFSGFLFSAPWAIFFKIKCPLGSMKTAIWCYVPLSAGQQWRHLEVDATGRDRAYGWLLVDYHVSGVSRPGRVGHSDPQRPSTGSIWRPISRTTGGVGVCPLHRAVGANPRFSLR
jgi:hypothetical protein